jgi:ParB-like chromosome segregation protein Spo0J
MEKMMREQHPLSAAFPPMSDEERQELIDSIEDIGVQNPITIYEGKVIDGWHRYTVANELGMPCPEVDLPEGVDPRNFVLAQNKTRRHITKSQMAISFAKVYEWAPEGKPLNTAPSAELKTAQQLAEMSGVGKRTIEQAKKVIKSGSEKVVKAVADGKISAKRGAQIAKLDKSKQDAAIDQPSEPKPSILDGNAPDEDELRANEFAMEADRKLINAMLEADEPMKVLHEEVTRLNYLVAQKDTRIASLMNEKNTAVKMVKDLQRQLDKINKAKK